jgi:hypothetical protein
MLALLLTILLFVVIAGVGYWAITQLAAVFGLPAPIVVVIQVIIVIAAVCFLLEKTGLLSRAI